MSEHVGQRANGTSLRTFMVTPHCAPHTVRYAGIVLRRRLSKPAPWATSGASSGFACCHVGAWLLVWQYALARWRWFGTHALSLPSSIRVLPCAFSTSTNVSGHTEPVPDHTKSTPARSTVPNSRHVATLIVCGSGVLIKKILNEPWTMIRMESEE